MEDLADTRHHYGDTFKAGEEAVVLACVLHQQNTH